jgi:hypothetical protein
MGSREAGLLMAEKINQVKPEDLVGPLRSSSTTQPDPLLFQRSPSGFIFVV